MAPPSSNDERTATTGGDGQDTLEPRNLLAFWPGQVAAFALPALGHVTIGRAEGCDIQVDHASISRRHASLHIAADGLWIEDLGSSNGTRLSGRRLPAHERVPVVRGALIEVGLATLVIHGSEVPASILRGAPPAAPADERSNGRTEPTMTRIRRLVELVAAARISVVLLGETGVGKEVTAEAIHRHSPRAAMPLLRLNCGAFPEALLESELFGYERGAFTGAGQSKAGLLESASGGTVFLDEVAELPLVTQAKLLRVVESREVLRLGALAPRPIDVRFIAATNRDLEGMVAAGAFRADMFYRLNGMTITIPPLRERTEEIPALVETFIAQASRDSRRPVPRVTAGAMAALRARPWPGNVRELRNAVERALVLCGDGAIDVEHLPEARFTGPVTGPVEASPGIIAPTPQVSGGLKSEVDAFERQRIVDALAQSLGNQTRAAQLLGISRRTLLGRLDAYGLPRPRKQS
jgi:two-component system response regulator AtoC